MSTQKQRLQIYAKSKGLSQNNLERELGMSNGALAKQDDELSDNVLGKIARIIPELNISWLLTGEGTMSIDDHSNQSQQTPIDTESLLIETLRDQIEMQKKYISVLEERIATLKKEKTFADVSTAHTA